jgi:uncharacterized OsmC-like protein
MNLGVVNTHFGTSSKDKDAALHLLGSVLAAWQPIELALANICACACAAVDNQ